MDDKVKSITGLLSLKIQQTNSVSKIYILIKSVWKMSSTINLRAENGSFFSVIQIPHHVICFTAGEILRERGGRVPEIFWREKEM